MESETSQPEHLDLDVGDVPVPEQPDEVLDEQRAAHAPRVDLAQELPQHEVNEEGVGALINNTGEDGGAASG